jgi:hypothetical protein
MYAGLTAKIEVIRCYYYMYVTDSIAYTPIHALCFQANTLMNTDLKGLTQGYFKALEKPFYLVYAGLNTIII